MNVEKYDFSPRSPQFHSPKKYIDSATHYLAISYTYGWINCPATNHGY